MASAQQPKRSPVICHGHSRPIVEVNYSVITPEGYFLASASKDGKPMLRFGESGDWYGTFEGMEKVIRIYDLARPDQAPQQLAGAPSGIRSLTWLQGDQTLLCSFTDKPGVGVYDMRSLSQVQMMQTAAPVTSVELSFDAQYLTMTDGRSVRFMEANGLQLLKELTVPRTCESASWAPSKRRFVTGGEDMWVYVYDYDTGLEIECNKGHHGPVHTIRWAPTYETYASGSEDGTIRIWSLDGSSEGGGAAAGNPPVTPPPSRVTARPQACALASVTCGWPGSLGGAISHTKRRSAAAQDRAL
ncbi:MAG: hypothetical protein WDW38_005204 [Sanguina aurantia]